MEFVRQLLRSNIVMDYVHQCLQGNKLLASDCDWVSINIDGATKEGLSNVVCGGVVRACVGAANAYIAELWGALEGLTFACERSYTKVELQIDSLAIVQCLQNQQFDSTARKTPISQIRSLFNWIWSVRVRHIFREANMVVDGLANLDCSLGDHLTVFDSPPPLIYISHLAYADVNGVFTRKKILISLSLLVSISEPYQTNSHLLKEELVCTHILSIIFYL